MISSLKAAPLLASRSFRISLCATSLGIISIAVAANAGPRFGLLLLIGGGMGATLEGLGFGFAGETDMMSAQLAFWPAMAAWGFIIWEIFKGEASQINAGLSNDHVQKAYRTMTLLVTVGWAIYPLGYFLGYFLGGADAATLNIVYNIADVWNKIAFGVVIWAAAVADTESKAQV